MPNDEKGYGNRRRVIERIGSGGQGVVYKVADVEGLPTQHALETTLKAFGTMPGSFDVSSSTIAAAARRRIQRSAISTNQ